MSFDSPISTRDTPGVRPLAQAQVNNPNTQELLHATYCENIHLREMTVNLEKKVQLSQQSLSEIAHEKTQMSSALEHSQKTTAEMRAFAKNLHFQLRQQAATVASRKEECAEAIRIKKWEERKLMLEREQLKLEYHQRAQSLQFVGALNFMKREDFDNLLGHRVDLDDVLANYPAMAYKVGTIQRDNAAKVEDLEKVKETHEQFVDIVQQLLKYAGQGDIGKEFENEPPGNALLSGP